MSFLERFIKPTSYIFSVAYRQKSPSGKESITGHFKRLSLIAKVQSPCASPIKSPSRVRKLFTSKLPTLITKLPN